MLNNILTNNIDCIENCKKVGATQQNIIKRHTPLNIFVYFWSTQTATSCYLHFHFLKAHHAICHKYKANNVCPLLHIAPSHLAMVCK